MSREGANQSCIPGSCTCRVRAWARAACIVVLAGLSLTVRAASPAEAAAKYRDGRREEAMRDYDELAGFGNPGAQLVLGVALIDGKDLTRDVPKGVAWLQIAGEADNADPAIKARARQIYDDVAPRLSGADLIRVDQHVADYRARRSGQVQRSQDRAMALLFPATPLAPSDFTAGCALDSSLPDCAEARRALMSSPTCGGQIVPADAAPSTRGPLAHLVDAEWPTDRFGSWTMTYAAHVDRSGWVCRVRVVGSSGRADVDRKALESIRAWRLQPAISNGMAVEGVYLGTFIYKR